jgi:hypothetical protein
VYIITSVLHDVNNYFDFLAVIFPPYKYRMIYIFGGSFATDHPNSGSWTDLLSKQYKIKNLAKDNSSNGKVYLDLLSVKDILTNNDILIVVWNDFLLPHINQLDDVDDKPKLMELYIKHFYNEELVFEQYKLYLNAFKEIAEEKGATLIALWSAPSNYINNFIWPWEQDHHLNYKKHTYAVDFPNDIRPSLIYYSKLEIKDLTEQEQSAMFACDSRPNHIADMQVHASIFNAVNAVIQGTKTGIINLDI